MPEEPLSRSLIKNSKYTRFSFILVIPIKRNQRDREVECEGSCFKTKYSGIFTFFVDNNRYENPFLKATVILKAFCAK